MAILLAFASGCQRAERSPRAETKEDKLVVYAAASLRDAFNRLGEEFRRSQPNVTVVFNFSGSQELRTQIEHGAPADVFASADERNMNVLEHTQLVDTPVLFAQNELVIVVAREKSSMLRALDQLPLAERLVFGARDVPVGMYTEQVLERASRRWGAQFAARVESHVVSRELNVRQVLAKVLLGEADAGIVYRTDVISKAGSVSVVDIEPEFNVTAGYPIAVLKDAAHPKLGHEWISLLLSKHGRRLLSRAGFELPKHEVTQ